MVISKEAELFEKANIVDVGLQPNEFKPRRRNSNQSLDPQNIPLDELRQKLDKTRLNEVDDGEVDEGLNEFSLNIDEVDKADNNLIVDEEFQKSLSQRASQFLSFPDAHLGVESFPQVPKPQVDYTYTDSFDMLQLAKEWFSSKEWENMLSYQALFESRFDVHFKSLDFNEKEDIILELIQENVNQDLLLNNLSCLSSIVVGFPTKRSGLVPDIDVISENVRFVTIMRVVPFISTQLKLSFENSSTVRFNLASASQCLFHCCTILYFLVLVALNDGGTSESSVQLRNQLSEISILDTLMKFVDEWRWNSRNSMRIRNIITLLSRSLQFIVGDFKARETAKRFQCERYEIQTSNDPSHLVASPIDFHIFRSELTSRFPSFIPPPSQLPDGFDQTSSLAQFLNIQKIPQPKTIVGQMQPPLVHISTPAPSPSSSPSHGSRNIKTKRGYQIDQSYPLLYPNDDSVIPKSVEEACDIFSSRVKHTLASKQIWNEIRSFVKQERGWIDPSLEIVAEFHEVNNISQEEPTSLKEIEKFYDHNLPYFSSLVHVILQIIITSQDTRSLLKDENDSKTLELLRQKEIVLKESSMILVLLLKWLKVSHILKFENLCTIIYDSNYFGIMNQYLKSLGTGIFERVNDTSLHHISGSQIDVNFCFTLTSLLTVTSKVLSNKVQRILALCENDIPLLLRNIFEFYNLQIWHPALKIVKEVTPFKGKKWKSNNMDSISLVYLHQKPGLRDNWLSGRDVDSEIGDAYGQEIALRALIQFYNMRRYKTSMGQLGYSSRPGNFFTRESEIMGGG